MGRPEHGGYDPAKFDSVYHITRLRELPKFYRFTGRVVLPAFTFCGLAGLVLGTTGEPAPGASPPFFCSSNAERSRKRIECTN